MMAGLRMQESNEKGEEVEAVIRGKKKKERKEYWA